jgi:hypothetical protein
VARYLKFILVRRIIYNSENNFIAFASFWEPEDGGFIVIGLF